VTLFSLSSQFTGYYLQRDHKSLLSHPVHSITTLDKQMNNRSIFLFLLY